MKWIKASERLPMFSSRTISRFIASQIILFDAQDFAIRNPNRSNEWEWLDESEPSPGEDVQRMAEQTIKEIAGIAWKGAANAFRMYPENKHTFFGYWDAAKNQFAGYSAHPPAPAGMEEAVSSKIKKYQGLINSLELHIKTSNPNETELFAVRMRINTYKDIISDLTALSASTPPAKDNWVKIEYRLPEEEEWVLVHNQEVDDCPVTIGVYVNGRWRILELGVDVEQIVTHWQPLPTPPTT